MPSCCGGSSCACKIEAGSSVVITGTGTPNDPFILSADLGLAVVDNEVFDLTLGGTGTEISPWTLEMDFAASARLTDIPDVSAPAPAAGQVLAWNAVVQQWTAQAPTTAPTGAVQHNSSLTGDGSAGAPLGVVGNGTRFIIVDANGVGLTDAGINRQVRHWINTSDRGSAAPPPELNTLSMLDALPGRVDYWSGSAWLPLKENYDETLIPSAVGGAEFLRLSGPWTTQRRTQITKQVEATTDGAGEITLLSSTDLSGKAGIISVQFQETGSLAVKAIPLAVGATVKAKCYHLTDGALWPGQAITGTVFAVVY
jgi:hypothetical protein